MLLLSMLQLNNYSVFAKEKQIIKSISYIFKKGYFYALLGPNGSGKSTLGLSIAGDPRLHIPDNSEIIFNKHNLNTLSSFKRARLGIYYSFQHPPDLQGITIYQLCKYALDEKTNFNSLLKQINLYARSLHISKELLERSLHENFSGGERKKIEMLLAFILNPKLLIFDEIDTGVDVDSMKILLQSLSLLKNQNKTIILITHQTKIFKSIHPDIVLILKSGKIVKSGDKKILIEIEKNGYDSHN